MRIRFAPSPTGQLHVGNARTALFNWLFARGAGMSFVLRIEDTDTERSSYDSERSILEDLRWLGLDWDEGPDVGGDFGPYRQSERLELYQAEAKSLLDSGHAYYCFCSPEQLEIDRRSARLMGTKTGYSGRCRNVTAVEAHRRISVGSKAAIRLRVPASRELSFDDLVRGKVTFRTEVIGDPVLLKSDGWPAYNFAVVVDDLAMKITHAIRGEDHISNTPRQLLVYEALGQKAPKFGHLALVMGPDHAPLSKRHGVTSVAALRNAGYLPESLMNYLALLGWSPRQGDELLDRAGLVNEFSIKDVVRSAAVFDKEKLAWVNRRYLKATSTERLARLSTTHFERCGLVSDPDSEGLNFLSSIMPMASESVDTVSDIPDRLRFLFDFDPEIALDKDDVIAVMSESDAHRVVEALVDALRDITPTDRNAFRRVTERVKVSTGLRARALFHPIRVALTGSANGPELDLAVPAMERGAHLSTKSGTSSVLGPLVRAESFLSAFERRKEILRSS